MGGGPPAPPSPDQLPRLQLRIRPGNLKQSLCLSMGISKPGNIPTMTNASQGAVFDLEMTGKKGGEGLHGMEGQGGEVMKNQS